MAIDASFWVAISFVIFIGALIYLKVPQKINGVLNKLIFDIKNELDESEKLRSEAKTLLDNAQSKLDTAENKSKDILADSKKESERLIIEMNDKFHKNSEIKNALKSNHDIFLYGIEEVGKSFLLQAVCNFYGSEKKSSLYVPIKETIKLNTDFLDSLDNLDVVCIDDIELIKNNKDWEIAIFNLINNSLLSKCRLIFSSSINPSTISFKLEDLSSRIKKIESIELLPISKNKLYEALKFIADLRSINIGEKEINYLITYSKRNISDLLKTIEKLDKLSVQLKRKITIPMIKDVI